MDGFGQILARYGQDVTVRYGDGRPERAARAFLQPIVERREDWRQEMPTPLGIVRRGRFLYLGEPGVELTGCEELEWNGEQFRVQAVEAIYVGGRLSHWWAVAVPEGE